MVHHPTITEHEILAFLRAVEAGDIKLVPVGDPQEIYAANVTYNASNGWVIVIFNDANEWDYIDSITADDGRHITYEQITEHYYRIIGEYEPIPDMAWKRYQLPGIMKFRCVDCDARALGMRHYLVHKEQCDGP